MWRSTLWLSLLTSALLLIALKDYYPTLSSNKLISDREGLEGLELRVSDLINDDDQVHIEACDNITEPVMNHR